MPDVPTVAEALNLPDYEVGTWFGFVAFRRRRLKRSCSKLSADVAEIIAEPAVKAKLADLGMDVAPRKAPTRSMPTSHRRSWRVGRR